MHAHDWLVTHPAITLAEHAGVPLVATIHATEAGRHSGWLSQPLNQQVHSVEWWLANRADALITCSAAMRAEVAYLFELEPPNLGDPQRDRAARLAAVARGGARGAGAAHARRRAAGACTSAGWSGRRACTTCSPRCPGCGGRIPARGWWWPGKGVQAAALVEQARKLRVRRAVDFVGHLPDRALVALLAAADVVVLPSRYEPFGIVALEAAAAGAPLVASTAGGLAELVVRRRDRPVGEPGDVDGIVAGVRAVLADPAAAARRARAAKARLAAEFDWTGIAEATAAVYRAASVRDTSGDSVVPRSPPGNAFRD